MSKKSLVFVFISAICFLISVISAYAQGESITITTYYPSPYGAYREMRAQRMAIGDDYIQGGTYDWEETDGDGGEIDYQADLVVQGNVGIGTTSPEATLHLNGTAKIFGVWETRNAGTEYTASTDGFVVAYDTERVCIEGYTPSATMRARAHTITDNESITFPVRKGDTWRVISSDCGGSSETPNPTVYWLPIGN